MIFERFHYIDSLSPHQLKCLKMCLFLVVHRLTVSNWLLYLLNCSLALANDQDVSMLLFIQLLWNTNTVTELSYYLRQGGNVFARLCLFVSLCVSKITQQVMEGFFWNFLGMSRMAKTTNDSILAAIWKEFWILDHFEIFVNIVFNWA